MKYYITYFYNIRFFKPYDIPFSTAIWDQPWFHEKKGNNHYFKDKNGVYNGLRISCLAPEPDNHECTNCWSDHDPTKCTFIQNYKKQLDELDFDQVKWYLETTANNIKAKEGFEEEPNIILLVYEKPDNPCSERWPLKEYFKAHGIELEEWRKG